MHDGYSVVPEQEGVGPIIPGEVESHEVRDLKYLHEDQGGSTMSNRRGSVMQKNLPLHMKYCRAGNKAQRVSWQAFISLKETQAYLERGTSQMRKCL